MHALKTEKVPELVEIFDDGSPWERRSHEKNAPAIYVTWFVDADGNSPTPKEFRQVAKSLRNYVLVKDVQKALEVEKAGHRNPDSLSTADIHSLLKGDTKDGTTKAEQILTFCFALEGRLNLLPSEVQDKPLKWIISYTGSARCFSTRQEQHETCGAWFPELFKAVSKTLFESRFDFHTYPVCFLANEKEADIAEMVIACISD